jgi:dTMP kinase
LGLFITFEGGEGSGKSTQAEILADRLEREGFHSTLVREPGTTPLGWYLRDWLKREKRRGENISHGAELFLFAAARAEFVAKVLTPALKGDRRIVIADRYADSTTAYQGYGRKLPLDDIERINRLATLGKTPKLTFLLDCSPAEGLERVGSLQIRLPMGQAESSDTKRMDREGTSRFEEESLSFHERVRTGYLDLANKEPDRWAIIDATESIETISEAIWERTKRFLAPLSPDNEDQESTELPLFQTRNETSPDEESN